MGNTLKVCYHKSVSRFNCAVMTVGLDLRRWKSWPSTVLYFRVRKESRGKGVRVLKLITWMSPSNELNLRAFSDDPKKQQRLDNTQKGCQFTQYKNRKQGQEISLTNNLFQLLPVMHMKLLIGLRQNPLINLSQWERMILFHDCFVDTLSTPRVLPHFRSCCWWLAVTQDNFHVVRFSPTTAC